MSIHLRLTLFWLSVPLALAAPLSLAGVPPRPRLDYDPPYPSAEQRQQMRKGHLTTLPPAGPRDAAQAEALVAQDDFDVLSYLLDLGFFPQTQRIEGQVTVRLRSRVDGLQSVTLDLMDNMAVSAVEQGAFPLSFSHQSDLLQVTLQQPLALAAETEIRVTYAGSPVSVGFGSFGWNKYIWGGRNMMAWSLSEPEGARSWWPCKDRPDDKALVEEWWTVPGNWIATGNGVLQETVPVPGGRVQFKWKPSHPLTTYLVSIAATDYVSFSDTYTALDGSSMPVDYYVYSEDLADAQQSFSNTVAMIGYYAGTFGEYPFVEDKYGMSAFPWSGAMEHTTNTSYGYLMINGGHGNDYTIAHELAHQWWGDSVSPQDWPNVWLNEGFATYSEALWAEHLNGAQGYQDYMNSLWSEHFSGPVYDPLDLFGSTVYDKGGWVLHMLRGVMGATPFFDGLRSWYGDHRDGNGTTPALRQTMETFYGSSLQWFFDEWVYGENSPRYEYGFASADLGDGGWRNTVRIRQVQTDAGVFTMPLQLTLVMASGNETRTVWNSAADEDFFLETSEPLDDVLLDEKDWVLKASVDTFTLPDADADGVPDRNDNCPAVANPVQADFDGDGSGDACDDDDDGDLLADGSDCAPLDATQGEPAEVMPLRADALPGGIAHLAWDATARADSYDVLRSDADRLPLGDYGSCIARGLLALEFDDELIPSAGSSLTYLVRGYDEGCGGEGSLGQDSGHTPRAATCP